MSRQKKTGAIVIVASLAALALILISMPFASTGRKAGTGDGIDDVAQSLRAGGIIDFYPSKTPTPTTAPTYTPTPDATGNLPIPVVTAATRSLPGDHYPTTVAFVATLIAAETPNPTSVHSVVDGRVELWAPRSGLNYGASASADDVISYLGTLMYDPQATPMVQGYFLSHWGTPVSTPDPDLDMIAIVTTFYNDTTPVPFPTDSQWFNPTAQAHRIRPSGDVIHTDPLTLVFLVTDDSTQLVRIITNDSGYYGLVETMQYYGWGPYYTFRTP